MGENGKMKRWRLNEMAGNHIWRSGEDKAIYSCRSLGRRKVFLDAKKAGRSVFSCQYFWIAFNFHE